MSFNQFKGKLTVSTHNNTHDKVVVAGVVDRIMYLGLNRTSVTLIGPHQNFSLKASIHSNSNDNYVLKASVPWGTLNDTRIPTSILSSGSLADVIANESWGVDVASNGTILVVPMPGTAPGTYYVTISTWSKTVSGLVDEALVEVVVPRYDSLGYTVSSDGWENHTITVENMGNVDRNLRLDFDYSHESWVIINRNNITTLPGRTYETGLYVRPPLNAAWPDGTQTVYVNVTDMDTSTVVETLEVNFTYPNPVVSNLTITGPSYSGQGTVATYTVNVTNSGNESALVAFTALVPAGWARFSSDYVSIPVGEAREVTLTVTQSSGAWGPGTHTFPVGAVPVVKAHNAISANATILLSRPYAGATNVTVGAETADYPGSMYDVSVSNGGILMDNFTLEAYGLPSSWFSFNVSELSLGKDGKGNITVYVHPDSPTYLPGPLNFTLVVLSENDPTARTEVLVNFTMPDLYGFNATSDRDDIYLSPNGNASFNLLVESLANVNDTLAITDASPSGWTVNYTTPMVSTKGITVFQTVNVTASGGTVGEYYWINLTLTSTGDANRTQNVSVRVLVIAAEKVDLANVAGEAAALAELAYYLDAAGALGDFA
ncbi:MAG: hypothetical protein JSW25_07895, partial [Thermoplasmata archaeon]